MSRNLSDKNLTCRYYTLVDPFIRAIVPNYPTVAKSTATISSFGWQSSCCILSCCILGGNVFERLTIRKWKMYLVVFSSLCVSFYCSLYGLSMPIHVVASSRLQLCQAHLGPPSTTLLMDHSCSQVGASYFSVLYFLCIGWEISIGCVVGSL